MLLLPPRHGKSELASKRFPAWCLGRNPSEQFISVSATAELAADFGRDVRNIINGQDYKALFKGTKLAEDSQAKGKWHTDAGGIYYSVGVGGSLLGRGGHKILIDDPYASMEDAQSETVRKRVYEWYTGTAYNRLMPNGSIVLINHRMHEDDLTGQLLAQQAAGGDQWEVVELPAINDDGEALWPEHYTLEDLRRIQTNTLPRFWSALYQQRPAPEEGEYFKRDWFNWYTHKPKHLRTYGASDYAVTEKGGDYTVHIVAGVDPEDNLYILDVWRGQTASDKWIEVFLDLVKQHKPLMWGEEQGQIVKSLGPFIDKRQRERRVYCRREQFTSVADKPTRCRAFQARASMGKVYLPENAHWVADMLHECLTFPVGKHDDQVDVLGLIGRMLDQMVGGKVPKTNGKREDKWDRAFKRRQQEQDMDGESWRTL
jgi:predicted phage terminase large subunit-like protein